MSDQKLWDQFVRMENERDHLRADLAEAKEDGQRKQDRIERLEGEISRLIAAYEKSHSPMIRADCWHSARAVLEEST